MDEVDQVDGVDEVDGADPHRGGLWGSMPGVVWIVLLVLIATLLFAYSVDVRSPWFGTSPISLETWLNSATVLWAKNWCDDGAFASWFAYFWDPNSIELPTLESREMYSSYPPGGVLPIYLLSKMLHRAPSISMVMAYSLFNQWAVTVLLAMLVFAFLRYAGNAFFDAFVLSLIPILVVLFLPGPATLFQMAYFHVAVLLPFVAYVFLELARDSTANARARMAISFLLGLVAFYGTLTDWLFVFAAFCLYLKRLATGGVVPFRRDSFRNILFRFVGCSARFWLPSAMALSLFAGILYRFDRFGNIAGRLNERSGMASHAFPTIGTNNFFWRQHIIRGYGAIGKYLIFASCIGLAALLAMALIRVMLRRQPNERFRLGTSLIFLLLMPCLLHVFILRQDSAHFFHYFTAAKFAIPLATIPFVLLPVTLLAGFNLNLATCSIATLRARFSSRSQVELGNENLNDVSPRWSLVSLALIILAGYYVHGEFPLVRAQLEKFFPVPTKDPVASWAFLGEHTGYEDVCFTANTLLEIDATPMRLAHSMKRVYIAASVQEIYAKVRPVEAEYIVDFVVRQDDLPKVGGEIPRLLDAAYEHKTFEDIHLYKIRKADFLSVCRELGIG